MTSPDTGPTGTAPDLAALVAHVGAACRTAGLPVGPDRAARFAAALVAVAPSTTSALRDCARATLVADPADLAVLESVLDRIFGAAPAPWPGCGCGSGDDPAQPGTGPHDVHDGPRSAGTGRRPRPSGGEGDADAAPAPSSMVASAAERLAEVPFDELTADELRELAAAMASFRLVTPLRRTRRMHPERGGREIDLRATLRAARRTGGDPVRTARRSRRVRPRRLVVLCDVSASMEPWSRALLQLLWCARTGGDAEVFTFATRLTRVTAELGSGTPGAALDRAARAVRDRAGGTRIGDALRAFLDGPGARGTARGSVVLIVSDGWETGEPERLERQMARLSRLAHRIVWCNPRTRLDGYRPLVGGMAAAWPYCDAVVSAHSLAALDELLDALGGAGGVSRPLPSRAARPSSRRDRRGVARGTPPRPRSRRRRSGGNQR